ncbi:MAG: L-threonylcarbamoyladenylate synthase [Anaerolineaceae bacterium]|nr:L-threonylcarbamoyladenylate synthase [Anaerolineaceae bacterium]
MLEIINLLNSYEQAIERSIEVLNKGGLIVFPTDTVYGLASKYDENEAIQRIYQVKGRDQTKALAVLIGNTKQVELIAAKIPKSASKLMEKFWPGALTIVVKKRMDLKSPLSIDNSIGIRIPDDEFVRELSNYIGPLATTSANLSGYPNTKNIFEVIDQIGDFVDLVIDGGECSGGIPSTVVDSREEEIKILRVGAISEEDILRNQVG